MISEQSIFEPPPTKPALSEYQLKGAKWLASRRRAILADDIGLGKTATAIAAADLLSPKQTLVISPLSLLPQWREEIQRFARDSRNRWTLVNYEKAKHSTKKYDCLIIDEASYIKSPEAQRSEAVLKIALKTPSVFFLTATPVRNHPSDLINMIFACSTPPREDDLSVPLKAVWWRWARKYFNVKQGYFGGVEVGRLMPFMREEWDGLVENFMLRRTKEMLQLPPLSHEGITVPWGDAMQECAYRTAEAGVIYLDTGEGREIANALTLSMRLRQCALDPALFGGVGGSGKTDWVVEYMQGEGQNHKTLLFTEFASYAVALAEKMKKWKPALLVGSMGPGQRAEQIALWKSGKTNLFILSSQAGGFGLNLQEADVVIHADLPWTPDVLQQRTGRAYRRGQQKPVHEIILGHKDTIDGHMYHLLCRKHKIASETVAIATVLQEIRGKLVGK